jgi:hypothetical protein
MKRIALLGIPGSGKSRLAAAIRDELIRNDGQGCGDCNTPVEILDDYAYDVRDKAQYAIGLEGGYMANVSIGIERYNRERDFYHEVQPKTLIVCGTVIESSVYLAQHFERSLPLQNTDEEKIQEAQRLESTVKMLAILYMDTFSYEKAFYLPSTTAPGNERWLTFERNLQASFSAYNAPVTSLMIEEYKDEEDLLKRQVAKVLAN